MEKHFRLEVILDRLLSYELYFRDMMKVDLRAMERIKYHREKVISIEKDEVERETSQQESEFVSCEHDECHVIRCMVNER